MSGNPSHKTNLGADSSTLPSTAVQIRLPWWSTEAVQGTGTAVSTDSVTAATAVEVDDMLQMGCTEVPNQIQTYSYSHRQPRRLKNSFWPAYRIRY